MAYKFQPGQVVLVREDADLNDGVKHYRGKIGTIDHVAESTPELIFYCVYFGEGKWDGGYIREEYLDLVNECQGDFD